MNYTEKKKFFHPSLEMCLSEVGLIEISLKHVTIFISFKCHNATAFRFFILTTLLKQTVFYKTEVCRKIKE